MTVTMIAAVGRNGVIGADGWMPWHLPDDLRRFKALTMDRPLIMGRRTFEAIGRPLPGRRTIVVTRNPDWSAPGVQTAGSVPAALELAGAGEIMVAGGGEIYAAALPLADRLELTHVESDVVGDTFFPTIATADWERTAVEQHDGYTFATYRRRPPVSGPADPGCRRPDPVGSETDLTRLLADLSPELRAGRYVFCSVPGEPPGGVHPLVTVVEDEGVTLVLPAEEAAEVAVPCSAPLSWITLRVHSSLTAVGLTAAVATALTRDGISCNVIAGFHHDHLFVPADLADAAMGCLRALQHARA